MARLRWTAKAVADLEAIRDYIGRSSPRYGALVARRLVLACGQLRRQPASGRIVPELERPDVRELVRGSYRIVYRLVGAPDAPDAVARGGHRVPRLTAVPGARDAWASAAPVAGGLRRACRLTRR